MIKSHKLSRAFVLSIWLSETNSHRSSWATCTPMAMSPLMAKLPHRGPAPSLLGHHLQASFLRTRPCDELRIGTLLHSPVDGRDEQLHLSHAHRALETTFSQPAMLLALRLRFLVGFILRLLVCFDLGSSLLVCFSLGCSLQSIVFYVFSAFLSQYLRTCFLLRLFVCFLLR